MKVITVLGARPQFIKASVVSRAFKKFKIRETIIHTGQHFDREMSKIFFDEMQIPKPAYNLNIHSLNHGAMTGRMAEGIEKILLDEKPDMVLVYGDTNSTLAGALAAKKLHLKLAHVEAGLRSFNMKMPEELNRILTDRISDFLFCPTQQSVGNLEKEGFRNFDCEIVRSGDVMYDAALHFRKMAKQKSDILKRNKLSSFALCTLHRAENTDHANHLRSIIHALNNINNDLEVVMPVHPRTKKKLQSLDLKTNFKSISPAGYLDMLQLTSNAEFVMTDSGGLQKESYFFKKPCIVMRSETEWTELKKGGYVIICGTDSGKIISSASKILNSTDRKKYDEKFYGRGNASEIITKHLLKSV